MPVVRREMPGGLVLAGGRSSRMGQDKALLKLDEETLVGRAVRMLGEVCAEVVISGGEHLESYGRVVRDEAPGLGPLGGIVAGLAATSHEWVCVLAVDVPFVPAIAWRRMLEQMSDEVVAVLPQVEGIVQPLCGVYARSAVAGLRTELEMGNRKVLGALEAVGLVRRVDFAERQWFCNVNTPEEYRIAKESAERPAG